MTNTNQTVRGVLVAVDCAAKSGTIDYPTLKAAYDDGWAECHPSHYGGERLVYQSRKRKHVLTRGHRRAKPEWVWRQDGYRIRRDEIDKPHHVREIGRGGARNVPDYRHDQVERWVKKADMGLLPMDECLAVLKSMQ
jgi:hypothetical protein